MKVLFIYPNLNAQIGFNYGIAYMSGLLKAHGIETALLNVNEKMGYPLDLPRIRRDILAFRPDLIGFSVLTTQHKYALEIARDIKRYHHAPILFGGIHPTMDPAGVLAQPCVDGICVGEGEEALLEAVRRGTLKGVRNMGYVEGGRPVIEPLRPYVDVTSLPFKDYEIFDFQAMIDAKDGWVGLTASRGCPFRCTYCLNHKIMGLYREHGHLPREYLRRHTVDQIIAEIEYLLGRYRNIRMFIFDDDIFTFDREWLREFSERYRAVTDIGFVCNAHARVFDDDMARHLKEAGCRIVKFGLESGSDRIRRGVLHRYMTNDQIRKAFATAHGYGLHTSAFVMLGLPREEATDLMDTVRLLAAIQPGRVRWSLFFPFIGTRAYDIAKEGGFIDFELMKDLDNFTDETCMRLDPETDLLVEKLKDFFCLFINGYGNLDGKGRYRELVRQIERAGRAEWQEKRDRFAQAAKDLDDLMDREGRPHYTVRFNPFMGVRSDWKDDSLSS